MSREPRAESREPRYERVLEPELMDDERQSIAYAKADFSTSNQLFVDCVIQDFPGLLRHVVDIGCGPGDVDDQAGSRSARPSHHGD